MTEVLVYRHLTFVAANACRVTERGMCAV